MPVRFLDEPDIDTAMCCEECRIAFLPGANVYNINGDYIHKDCLRRYMEKYAVEGESMETRCCECGRDVTNEWFYRYHVTEPVCDTCLTEYASLWEECLEDWR